MQTIISTKQTAQTGLRGARITVRDHRNNVMRVMPFDHSAWNAHIAAIKGVLGDDVSITSAGTLAGRKLWIVSGQWEADYYVSILDS